MRLIIASAGSDRPAAQPKRHGWTASCHHIAPRPLARDHSRREQLQVLVEHPSADPQVGLLAEVVACGPGPPAAAVVRG